MFKLSSFFFFSLVKQRSPNLGNYETDRKNKKVFGKIPKYQLPIKRTRGPVTDPFSAKTSFHLEQTADLFLFHDQARYSGKETRASL